VTLVNDDRSQKWVEVDGGEVKMVEEVQNFKTGCPKSVGMMHYPVTMDFFHYTGKVKPWKTINWTSIISMGRTGGKIQVHRMNVWGFALREAWRKYELGPIRLLIPNISSSFYEDIAPIEAFLQT